MPLSVDEIQELYKDPTTGLCGLRAFQQRLKGQATPSAIRDAILPLEAYALNRPREHPKERRRIVVHTLNETWGMDLADLGVDLAKDNSGFRYILVGMDILSKFLVAEPMHTKTAVATRNALQAILQRTGRQPTKIWVDEGSEFKGAFRQFCNGQQIILYNTSNEGKSIYGEKSVYVLKKRLGRLAEQKGTWRWVDDLQQIVGGYNTTPSKPIGMAPADVTAQNAEQVFRRQYKDVLDDDGRLTATALRLSEAPKFALGDLVHISVLKNTFAKEHTQNYWTPERFRVFSVAQGNPLQYRLETIDPTSADELKGSGDVLDGSFYEEELEEAVPPQEWRVVVKERLPRGRVRVGWAGWPNRYDRVVAANEVRDI
jgi:hypothetical protein